MYQYRYVSLDGDGIFGGRGFSGHQEIINEYAAHGYRYVGFIPTDIAPDGAFRTIDLIFERDSLEGEQK